MRAAIGAALQKASLDVMLTGREHLRFRGTLRGIGKATAAERTAELLDRVGLTEAADRRADGYSGGMKRRFDLAMALVYQPRDPVPRRAHDRPGLAAPCRPMG